MESQAQPDPASEINEAVRGFLDKAGPIGMVGLIVVIGVTLGVLTMTSMRRR